MRFTSRVMGQLIMVVVTPTPSARVHQRPLAEQSLCLERQCG